MTGFDVLRDLHPPRLPEDFAALVWPEVLAGFGLGLLLALVIFAIVRPVLTRRPAPKIGPHLLRLRALPPEECLLAQARLLSSLGGALPAELHAALYAPTPPSAEVTARIEPLIRAAFRKADSKARAAAHV